MVYKNHLWSEKNCANEPCFLSRVHPCLKINPYIIFLQRNKQFSIPLNISQIICNYLASLNSIQSPHASHVTWISGRLSQNIKQNHQVCSSYVSPLWLRCDSAFLQAEIIHTTRFKGTQVQSDRYIGSLFRVDVPVPEIQMIFVQKHAETNRYFVFPLIY